MGNYVVTFARGFGSGGKEIASKHKKDASPPFGKDAP